MSLDIDQRKHTNPLETHESPLIWFNALQTNSSLRSFKLFKIIPLNSFKSHVC